MFKELIINFKNLILRNCNIIYQLEKTIDNLFFPRSKKENYAANDRIINYDKIYKLLEGKNYTEYDTINTKDLKEQIKLLVSSQNIILDWGSSFFVNGLFCNNSNIFFYGCRIHELNFEGLKIIYEIHKENNNIKYISYT
jgi:hypothetical protein